MKVNHEFLGVVEQDSWVLMTCKVSASTPLTSHIGCVGEIYFGPVLCWIRPQDPCIWLLFPRLPFPSLLCLCPGGLWTSISAYGLVSFPLSPCVTVYLKTTLICLRFSHDTEKIIWSLEDHFPFNKL